MTRICAGTWISETKTLQTDARLFRTQAGGNTILCIEENGVQLDHDDGGN